MFKNVFKIMVLGVFTLAVVLAFAAREATAADASKLFVEKKCNKCHAVSAYDVAKKESKGGDDEEDDGDEKVEPPDLSNVSTFHDAAFITAFLKKEVEHKPHAGNDNAKKHKTKFKGSDEEFKEIVDWLSTLNKAPKK